MFPFAASLRGGVYIRHRLLRMLLYDASFPADLRRGWRLGLEPGPSGDIPWGKGVTVTGGKLRRPVPAGRQDREAYPRLEVIPVGVDEEG